MKTTPEERANLRAALERCATRLVAFAICSARAISELLDDLDEALADLAALRRVEAERDELRGVLAEHYGWMLWTQSPESDDADTDAEVAKATARLRAQLGYDALKE